MKARVCVCNNRFIVIHSFNHSFIRVKITLSTYLPIYLIYLLWLFRDYVGRQFRDFVFSWVSLINVYIMKVYL